MVVVDIYIRTGLQIKEVAQKKSHCTAKAEK